MVPNENEINMIKFYYEDETDKSNTSKKIYIITITKTCNFDLVCKNCEPQNQSMGNVLYYTNDQFNLKSSCLQNGGEGVLKFLKKKYIKKHSK